eukprot:Selendium_serpulae@DN3620_c0_g1_i1.p1
MLRGSFLATAVSRRACIHGSTECSVPEESEPIRRVLLLSKVTLYDYITRKLGMDPLELREKMPKMWDTHQLHYLNLNRIRRLLRNGYGIHVKVTHSILSPTAVQALNGVDAIVSAGGDGTYLRASQMVPGIEVTAPDERRKNVWLFGVNTNPASSEGHLCLSSDDPPDGSPVGHQPFDDASLASYFASDIRSDKKYFGIDDDISGEAQSVIQATRKIAEMSFQPLIRQRISVEIDRAGEKTAISGRALNDVMVAKSDNAAAMLSAIKVNDGEWQRSKSSGILACTGTGSSAWAYNMDRVYDQNVKAILESFCKKTKQQLNPSDVESITSSVNNQLILDPSSPNMRYSVREPIYNRVFHPHPKSESCEELHVKSLSTNTFLYLDGLQSVPVPFGSIVTMHVDTDSQILTGR